MTSRFFIDVIGCAMEPVAFRLAMSAAGNLAVAASAVVRYAVAGSVSTLRR